MHRPRTETKRCKHGVFTYFSDDEYVGASLKAYGEYSEEEVMAMAMILEPGHTVVEVGANIGSLTVPMARMVGPTGKVIAFEAHPVNAALLRENIFANDLDGIVDVRPLAVTDHSGITKMPVLSALGHRNYGAVEINANDKVKTVSVQCATIDGLKLDKFRLLKIDVEGSERAVIAGAKETIRKHRPVIYIENDREQDLIGLIAAIVDLGYRLWWHRPPLFNPDNYFGEKRLMLPALYSFNMLCVPEEFKGVVIDGFDEVGDIRLDVGMYDREAERFGRIISRYPDDKMARILCAHNHHIMHRFELSASLLEENLRMDPAHSATHAIKAIHALQRGDWKEGWQGYEKRYEMKATQQFGDRPHEGLKWDGQPTNDPVLIWAEQGYGDSIMFARFVFEAMIRAPNLIIEVQPPLYELFEQSGIPGLFGKLVRMGRTIPKYKYHVSLPSLPAVLGLTHDDELRSEPYFKADKKLTQTWRDKGYKLGLCWKGSPNSERAYDRDIDDKLFKEMGDKYGPFLTLAQLGQFDGFADTAAAIASMDLVITVDTSVAHLAGALGVPTWLLLAYSPDWRWGISSKTTVWYDSVRIFRQPSVLDWESVIKEVSLELRKFMEQRDAITSSPAHPRQAENADV